MAEEVKKGTAGFWANVRGVVEADSTGVKETVTLHYVRQELDARAAKAIAAIDALSQLEGQLKKIRPDQEQFDLQGALVSATYSKQKLEERRRITDKTERIEAALTDVFEKADFDKLKKLNLQDKPDVAA